MARIKKAQDGQIVPIKRVGAPDLRTGQYKRLGRLSAKKPAKAKKVAKKMVERATRTERGEQYLKKNIDKLSPNVPELGKRGVKVKKKMVNGGSLKPVDKAKNPGLSKLPKAVRNKMGFQKNGGKSLKKQAAKKMTNGGKCRGGCY